MRRTRLRTRALGPSDMCFLASTLGISRFQKHIKRVQAKCSHSTWPHSHQQRWRPALCSWMLLVSCGPSPADPLSVCLPLPQEVAWVAPEEVGPM